MKQENTWRVRGSLKLGGRIEFQSVVDFPNFREIVCHEKTHRRVAAYEHTQDIKSQIQPRLSEPEDDNSTCLPLDRDLSCQTTMTIARRRPFSLKRDM